RPDPLGIGLRPRVLRVRDVARREDPAADDRGERPGVLLEARRRGRALVGRDLGARDAPVKALEVALGEGPLREGDLHDVRLARALVAEKRGRAAVVHLLPGLEDGYVRLLLDLEAEDL